MVAEQQRLLDVPEPMETGATISPCGTYRYTLLRRWEPTGPALRWIMLNPSTADADVDDPTIRRVVRFSRDAGYSAAVVANLYALRATDPSELDRHTAPVGRLNDDYLARLAEVELQDAGVHGLDPRIVVAWGARAKPDRVREVVTGSLADVPLLCLSTTREGHPRHPLYVPATQPLVPWRFTDG